MNHAAQVAQQPLGLREGQEAHSGRGVDKPPTRAVPEGVALEVSVVDEAHITGRMIA